MPQLLSALQHLFCTWKSGCCLTGCHNPWKDPSIRNPWHSPKIMYKSRSASVL